MELQKVKENTKQVADKVGDIVTKTGDNLARQVSRIADGETEQVKQEAIEEVVEQAVETLRLAKKQIEEKGINQEPVNLEITVDVVKMAKLKVTTTVPASESD